MKPKTKTYGIQSELKKVNLIKDPEKIIKVATKEQVEEAIRAAFEQYPRTIKALADR